MYFTQEDFRKIHEWLKRNSVKDSEFPLASTENGTEYITMVQNGKNVILPFNEFKTMVGGVITTIAAPTISINNKTITITASPSGATIYYTTGEDKYPEVDEEGNPKDGTMLYSVPFDIAEDTIIRAIATYTSEGKLLVSEVKEYNAIYEVPLQAPEITFNNNTITIRNLNDNENSLVYYTTDGSDPRDSATRTQYTTEPFTINYTVTTIKAVVLLGNIYSEVTSIEVQYVKRGVDKPRAESWTYDGSERNAFSNEILNNEDYTLVEEGSVIRGTNAGEYIAKFTLNYTDTTIWSDGDTNKEIQVEWSIAKKPLTINLSIEPEKSTYEVGDIITFSASIDDDNALGIFTFHRNSATGEPFGSSYTLQDSDKDELTKIYAVYTLTEDSNRNYSVSPKSKNISVKEKEIPYEYVFLSSSDITNIKNNAGGDKSNIQYNHVSAVLQDSSKTFTKIFNDKKTSIPITIGGPYLVVAYPNIGEPELRDDTNNEFDSIYTNNTMFLPYIKIYKELNEGEEQTLVKTSKIH